MRLRRRSGQVGQRLLGVAGGVALFSALVLVAFHARPTTPGATPAPGGTATTATGVPRVSAQPTADRNLPAACSADVRGTSFASGSLDDRLAAARSWAVPNSGRTASVVLTDTVLTESVRAQLSGPGAPPFVDPSVTIRPEGIRVSGTATAAFLRFPIRATLVPELTAGTLRFAVRDLDTGGLPAAFRPRVNELLAQAADPTAWRLPLRVESFVLRSGCAVLIGQA